jgi:hypothetical protein
MVLTHPQIKKIEEHPLKNTQSKLTIGKIVGLQSNMEKPRLQASGRMTMFKTPVG